MTKSYNEINATKEGLPKAKSGLHLPNWQLLSSSLVFSQICFERLHFKHQDLIINGSEFRPQTLFTDLLFSIIF